VLEEWVEWPEGALAEESAVALAEMRVGGGVAAANGSAESAGPRAWGSSLLLALATQSAEAVLPPLAQLLSGAVTAAVSRAFPSWKRSILTEVYLYVVTPVLVTKLRMEAPAQGPPGGGVRELEALIYVGGLLAKPLADFSFDVVGWACRLPSCAATAALGATDAGPSGLSAQAVLERRMAWLYGQLTARPAQIRVPSNGESKRLVVESPWSQFTSECQRF
jgi:hypothetical protein